MPPERDDRDEKVSIGHLFPLSYQLCPPLADGLPRRVESRIRKRTTWIPALVPISLVSIRNQVWSITTINLPMPSAVHSN